MIGQFGLRIQAGVGTVVLLVERDSCLPPFLAVVHVDDGGVRRKGNVGDMSTVGLKSLGN